MQLFLWLTTFQFEPSISNPEAVKLHGDPVPSAEEDDHELKTVDRRLDFDGGDMVELLATEKTTTIQVLQ